MRLASKSGNTNRIITLKSIAAVLFLLSWISQNFIQANFSSQKREFEYDMAFISNEMSVITPWLILFNQERKRTDPDPEMIWNASYQIVTRVGTVLKRAERYYDAEIVMASLTSAKVGNILSDMAKARKENRIQDVVELTELVQIAFPDVDKTTRDAMNQSYQKIANGEDFAKWIFLSLYLVASLLLAVGYLRHPESQTQRHSGR
jgi:hypothetical protein